MIMGIPVIDFDWTQPDRFVDFWSVFYTDPREEYYVDNIGRPLTANRVRRLYLWKNGGELSERKRDGLERNVVDRLRELRRMAEDHSPLDFLLHFARGGPIWRVFLLHIWQPDKYPIYDQHTYRAMRFIQRSRIEQIPSKLHVIAQTYVNDYVPFFNEFRPRPDRKLDKALFAFGKFLRTPLGKHLSDGGRR